MPLLEIVVHQGTSPKAAAAAHEVGIAQGKTCIIVKDSPGFYTTRILGPMLGEAASLISEGVGIRELESHFTAFGFPVGPITLMDEVGIDVGAHVAKDLTKAFGDRMAGGDPRIFEAMVSGGHRGRKDGKGFYLYEDKKSYADKAKAIVTSLIKTQKLPPKGREINPFAANLISSYQKSSSHSMARDEIQKRIVYRMINEAVMCLDEGIINSPTDGDLGAIMGFGFPPFLGGPFRYVDRVGVQAFVSQMSRLQQKFGDKFKPCDKLSQMAASGSKFYN
jgi:enoyl-CoA hydratase/long-chain 3-hydroxyacyl-CoA dehydrogenase